MCLLSTYNYYWTYTKYKYKNDNNTKNNNKIIIIIIIVLKKEKKKNLVNNNVYICVFQTKLKMVKSDGGSIRETISYRQKMGNKNKAGEREREWGRKREINVYIQAGTGSSLKPLMRDLYQVYSIHGLPSS